MPLVINTNTSATAASNHLDQNNLSLKKSLSRLSSGKRIVSSADDAGGLAVASKLNSTLLRNVRVRESLNNSLSFLQTQAGALQVVGKVLSRMTELKTHSLDISKNDQDYENYNKEFLELQGQLNQISRQKFNGISLFSDQMPKTYFGSALDTEVLHPLSDENESTEVTNVTRWGIYRNFSQRLERGDGFPSGFGENPPGDLLTFALSDEANGGSYADEVDESSGMMGTDIAEWTQMIGERNIDGKLALVAVQSGGWASSSNPSALTPENGYIPPFAKLYENYPRDNDLGIPGYDPTIPGSNQPAVSLGLSVLKNAFMTETENGNNLPFAMGLFIDDTGSVTYSEVDEAAHEFLDWVRTNYPQVAVSSQNDGVNWTNGIYSASSERWIQQGRIAVESMLDSDPVLNGAVSLGTLDNSKSGVKGLLDRAYKLEDFDMTELKEFEGRLSDALAINGSESSRAQYAIEELETKYLKLQAAHGRIMDVDFAQESTKLARYQILNQSSAQMMSSAVKITEIAKTVMGI